MRLGSDRESRPPTAFTPACAFDPIPTALGQKLGLARGRLRGTRATRIPALPCLRVERDFSQERHLHCLRRSSTTTFAEHVDLFTVMVQVAHVFDNSQDSFPDLLKHVYGFPGILERNVRRGSDHDCPGQRSGLDES